MRPLLSFLLLVSLAMPAHAQWGDLKLRFVVEGEVPPPTRLDVAKDDFCAKNAVALVNESLLVGRGGGLANVVVWLDEREKEVPVHESYTAVAGKEVVLKMEKCRFDPHVFAVRTYQKCTIRNTDQTAHAGKIDFFANDYFACRTIPAGDDQFELEHPEPRPVPVACVIHPWMSAYVVVQDHPYVGVSEAEGNIHLKNVPAGEWTFRVWHERRGFVQEATLDGKTVQWPNGRIEVEIQNGQQTNLGRAVLTLDQVKERR
jgi:hypothetical protein